MEFMDDAAWDFESIKWYDKLLMFATEYPIKQIELASAEELCVLSKKGPGVSVLNLYSLPPMLKRDKRDDEALTRHSDLKIRGGAFVSNHISQLACVYGKKYFYTSEEGVEGVNIYKTNCLESDKILLYGSIKTRGLKNPEVVAKSDVLVASGNTNQDILILNNNGEEIASHKWDPNTPVDSLTVNFLNNDTIIACTSADRKACILDLRQKQPSIILPGESGSSGWRLKTNHCEVTPPGVERFAFLSESGHLRLYDPRWCGDPTLSADLGCVASSSDPLRPCLAFDPSDPTRLSASGLDSRVYIVETRDGFSVTFTHSGHEHTDACDPSTVVVTHLWYHPGERRTLISAATNASLNCWTYNP